MIAVPSQNGIHDSHSVENVFANVGCEDSD